MKRHQRWRAKEGEDGAMVGADGGEEELGKALETGRGVIGEEGSDMSATADGEALGSPLLSGMDSRHRRRPSSDRFLVAFSRPPLSTSARNSDAGDELREDDVFFAGADFSNPPSTSFTPHHLHHNHNSNNKSFKPESFGILAALRDSDDNRSVFNHKVSPQPMMIPLSRRNSGTPEVCNNSPMPVKYHQSAPMKVPVMPGRGRRRRKGSAFGYEDDDDDDDDEGEMLPPHEIVARKMAKLPVLSCSVLEGAGRTLKGRDLRQVRNAVFRQTAHAGFDIRGSLPNRLIQPCGSSVRSITFSSLMLFLASIALIMVLLSRVIQFKFSLLCDELYTVLAIALAFSRIVLTSGAVVKGSVLCTDCDPHYDLSGIKVFVKCDQVKKLSMATTDATGAFETELPSNAATSAAPASENCLAKLFGGRSQLYALKKDMVSMVVPAQGAKNTYTLVTPLAFSKSCPGKCDSGLGSSKTFDVPIPPHYGLPPSDFFRPVLPIIGIP
ncbi:hypothetical protein Cgig2_000888 [Carnegiea gigantea]|uniref:Uncharacterized protein n=1 Tax=Carnegiea gigantea TaxID=171969 RepID=A0A9Q1GZ99_9CARY|nr:hypothetical protein Cgig2_000888 [Carnegiea gigantea]